jgi:hypothetical protein
MGHGDFSSNFFAPAFFLQVNHFCFPTEWICLTALQIVFGQSEYDGKGHSLL